MQTLTNLLSFYSNYHSILSLLHFFCTYLHQPPYTHYSPFSPAISILQHMLCDVHKVACALYFIVHAPRYVMLRHIEI